MGWPLTTNFIGKKNSQTWWQCAGSAQLPLYRHVAITIVKILRISSTTRVFLSIIRSTYEYIFIQQDPIRRGLPSSFHLNKEGMWRTLFPAPFYFLWIYGQGEEGGRAGGDLHSRCTDGRIGLLYRSRDASWIQLVVKIPGVVYPLLLSPGVLYRASLFVVPYQIPWKQSTSAESGRDPTSTETCSITIRASAKLLFSLSLPLFVIVKKFARPCGSSFRKFSWMLVWSTVVQLPAFLSATGRVVGGTAQRGNTQTLLETPSGNHLAPRVGGPTMHSLPLFPLSSSLFPQALVSRSEANWSRRRPGYQF